MLNAQGWGEASSFGEVSRWEERVYLPYPAIELLVWCGAHLYRLSVPKNCVYICVCAGEGVAGRVILEVSFSSGWRRETLRLVWGTGRRRWEGTITYEMPSATCLRG